MLHANWIYATSLAISIQIHAKSSVSPRFRRNTYYYGRLIVQMSTVVIPLDGMPFLQKTPLIKSTFCILSWPYLGKVQKHITEEAQEVETVTLLQLQFHQKTAFDVLSYHSIGVKQLSGRLRKWLEHPHKKADKLVSLVVRALILPSRTHDKAIKTSKHMKVGYEECR